MARKKGLGRGLDALLSGTAGSRAAETGPVRDIPVDLIVPSPYQPRTTIDTEALEALAQSIRAQGIVQPVVVRPSADGRSYELIAGERRWRAAQLAGLGEIPAIVRDVPDEHALGIALIENIQREDLNPVEEATALRRLIDEFGLTHQEVADAVGRSRAAVSNLLRLLDLDKTVRRMLENGEIEMGHARALLGLDEARRAAAAAEVLAKGLNTRQTEAMVRRLRQPASSSGRGRGGEKLDPDVRRLQDELSGTLGAPVAIESGRGGRGRLVIHYTSLDQLDGILERFK